MKKTLFEEKNESIWIKIEIHQTDDEKVIIYGCDSGKTVMKIKHQYDYEYYLTIEKGNVLGLMKKLKAENIKELFNWFVKEFPNEDAVSQIKERLSELDVKYQFSTY